MILVTGGTGIVGGNLLWHLLQDNERIIAICRKTSKLETVKTIFSFYTNRPDDYLNRIDWRIADVLDKTSLTEAFSDVAIVYHCAAVVSLSSSSNLLTDTNVLGTKNIVEIALEKKIVKLCFVSSIAACGKEKNKKEIDENAVWEDSPNRSPYARSKYFSELEVWKGIEKGLNAVIVNPGVILGVSGTNLGSSQLFGQVKKGLIFYTRGGSGYVDVRDVVKAMVLLTNSTISGERFILVGENVSNKEVLSWMADGFNKKHPFILVGSKLLIAIGFLSELLGKIFHFKPLVDRTIARSATQRDYYTSQKIKIALPFIITPIKKSIYEVCKFMKT